MQSIPVLRPNSDSINNVMQYYPRLRSSIDRIQNNAIINIQNAVRSKIARTKVKSVIEERKKQTNDKRNALMQNMQNTIMAQGVINELIDTAVNQSDKKKQLQKQETAATKIQDVFKKIKEKNKNKKELKVKLTKEKKRRLEAIGALKDRLKLEQEALTRYTDNPKKLAKMQTQIQKTITQIQMYANQYTFLTEKIEKI